MKRNGNKKQIIRKKLESLNFIEELFDPGLFHYKIPLGFGTTLIINLDDCILKIEKNSIDITIAKIETSEHLQILFDALVPENNRLPFN